LEENDLWDFTRILEEVKLQGLRPDIDVLFVDECQDLSRLQLDLCSQWGAQCDTVVFLGDADQALYRFAGACPEDFRDLHKDWSKVLEQSFRVSEAVHAYATALIRQIEDREDALYRPTIVEGRCYPCLVPDLSLEGSHMVLGRCNYHLTRWFKHLTKLGEPWHNPYRDIKQWNPTTTKTWTAVRAYDRVRQGLEITGEELLVMMEKLSADYMVRGIKTKRKKLIDEALGPYGKADVFWLSQSGWFQPAFLNFSDQAEDLFSLSGAAGGLISEHGPALTRKIPRVAIGTIHSVKGGESDHVWVDKSTSPTIGRAIMDPQTRDIAWADEVRCAYVGCTRARDTLGLLYPYGIENSVFV
jgi:hypothetical protein